MDEADIQAAKTQGSSYLRRKRIDVMALIYLKIVYHTLLLLPVRFTVRYGVLM
jgi:hypothetical protein